ncbi:MAG: hypothetical protein U0031_02920 [Thermomicrobiales bacterium]
MGDILRALRPLAIVVRTTRSRRKLVGECHVRESRHALCSDHTEVADELHTDTEGWMRDRWDGTGARADRIVMRVRQALEMSNFTNSLSPVHTRRWLPITNGVNSR